MTSVLTRSRIYLAGPDVFLPDADKLAIRKKAICAEHGLEGLWPLDNNLDLVGSPPRAAGLKISSANEELMQKCAAIIANLTPWHGPSADVGTCFELGFMRALGKPCFGYSNDARPFAQRVEEWVLANDHGPMHIDVHGVKRTAKGHMIESFQFSDNLMLDGSIHKSGGNFFTGAVPEWGDDYHTDLTAFSMAVAAAARLLNESQNDQGLS